MQCGSGMTIVVPVEHGGVIDFTRQFIFRAVTAIPDAFHAEIGAVMPSVLLFLDLNRIGTIGKGCDEFFRKNHFDKFRVFEHTKITYLVILYQFAALPADLDKRDGFRGGFGGAKEGHGSGRNHNHFQTVLTRRQNVSLLAAREMVEKETTCAHDYERYPKLGRCCKNGA